MRMLSLYVGDKTMKNRTHPSHWPNMIFDERQSHVPVGYSRFLEVIRGPVNAHLLYVPGLLHLEAPLAAVDFQLKQPGKAEVITAGLREWLIETIETNMMKFDGLTEEGHRYHRVYVARVLKALRGEAEPPASPEIILSGLDERRSDFVTSNVVTGRFKTTPKVATTKKPAAAKPGSSPAIELLERAKALGYKPEAAPNPGVAAMRIRNFLRNHGGER